MKIIRMAAGERKPGKYRAGIGLPAAMAGLLSAVFLCTGCSGKYPTSVAAAGYFPEHMVTESIAVQGKEETVPKSECGQEPEPEGADKKESAGRNESMSEQYSSRQSEDAKMTEISSGSETEELVEDLKLETVLGMPAGQTVEAELLDGMEETELDSCFYYEDISDEVFKRMWGTSYKEDCTVPRSELRYVRFLHHGFDGEVHTGEIVVNQQIASDIRDIFRELYDEKYPIEKAILIDEYDADDEASMRDNNTTGFNYRVVAGSKTLSNHAKGLAVDINPLYNPYVRVRNGITTIQPETAEEYTDRNSDCDWYIAEGDVCYEAFAKRGFTWGGHWKSLKDYQHFENAS